METSRRSFPTAVGWFRRPPLPPHAEEHRSPGELECVHSSAALRVEGESRDFARRELAASRHRLEDCSDLTPGNVDSLLQRLPGTTVQEIDHFIAELQALRQRCNTKRRGSSARSCNTRA